MILFKSAVAFILSLIAAMPAFASGPNLNKVWEIQFPAEEHALKSGVLEINSKEVVVTNKHSESPLYSDYAYTVYHYDSAKKTVRHMSSSFVDPYNGDQRGAGYATVSWGGVKILLLSSYCSMRGAMLSSDYRILDANTLNLQHEGAVPCIEKALWLSDDKILLVSKTGAVAILDPSSSSVTAFFNNPMGDVNVTRFFISKNGKYASYQTVFNDRPHDSVSLIDVDALSAGKSPFTMTSDRSTFRLMGLDIDNGSPRILVEDSGVITENGGYSYYSQISTYAPTGNVAVEGSCTKSSTAKGCFTPSGMSYATALGKWVYVKTGLVAISDIQRNSTSSYVEIPIENRDDGGYGNYNDSFLSSDGNSIGFLGLKNGREIYQSFELSFK